jgi:tRNA threonylcarbamoyladenosine biosynthesis protein TsaB
MIILGLDTATKFSAIAIFKDKKIYHYRINLGRELARALLPSLKQILEALSVKPEQIDYFAVGLGPGSFTGLRIGLATVKGLAMALEKKVIGIPTLDIIARNAMPDSGYNFFCPLIDAKRDLVFMSLYKDTREGYKRVVTYKLVSLPQLYKIIPKETLFLGDALKLYRKELMLNVKAASFSEEDFFYPSPEKIIEIAKERITQRQFTEIKKLKPIYLYPKECQIKNRKNKN